MSNIEKDLSFVVLQGNTPSTTKRWYYDSAYKCWSQTWQDAYRELGVKETFFSNEFTRQSEIDCIFYGEECIGLLFMRYADFNLFDHSTDSYFSVWNPKDIDALTASGNKVIICSNTTVAKKWRRNPDVSIKDLLLYFVCRRFIESGCDAMTATTRKTRSVHKLAERFGAKIISQDVDNFNEEDKVDLMAFYQDSAKLGDNPKIHQTGGDLWNRIKIIESDRQVVPFTMPSTVRQAV